LTQITDLLFQVNGLGADLESIDIEKSRDQGIRPHVDYLEMIGQPRPQSWEDYKQFIEDVNVSGSPASKLRFCTKYFYSF